MIGLALFRNEPVWHIVRPLELELRVYHRPRDENDRARELKRRPRK